MKTGDAVWFAVVVVAGLGLGAGLKRSVGEYPKEAEPIGQETRIESRRNIENPVIPAAVAVD